MIVTLMIGVSGSGKSTYIREKLPGNTVISADNYFTGPDGVYRFDPRKLGEAHADALRKYLAALHRGLDIVVDNTNTNTNLVNLAPYVALAEMVGATVKFIHLDVDPASAAQRNLHMVPADTVAKMALQIASAFAQWPPHWPRPLTIKA